MPISPKSVTGFYCGNNPVNWIDPWGLAGISKGRGDDWWYNLTEKEIGDELSEIATKYGKNSKEYKAALQRAKRILKHKGWKHSRFSKGIISKQMLKGLVKGILVYGAYKGLEWIDQNYFNLDGQDDFDIGPMLTPTMYEYRDLGDSPKLCPQKDPGDFPPLVPPVGGGYA